MKTTANAIIATIVSVSPAFAASGAAADEGGFLTIVFLAFGAAVVAFQVVPALVLLGSMLKGAFSAKTEESVSAR
ncbi:MAG: hypothetical protein ED859_14800 [Desulfuromonadales bacterium]|nr:MAG: hypothetical protein ED859_14800 [Desulfuromonadales bacterium]